MYIDDENIKKLILGKAAQYKIENIYYFGSTKSYNTRKFWKYTKCFFAQTKMY